MITPTTPTNPDLAPAWAVRYVRADRSGPGFLCGAALGLPATSNLLDHGLFSLFPAVLAGFSLILALVWMTRRWGLRPTTTTLTGPAPTRPTQDRDIRDDDRELVLQD